NLLHRAAGRPAGPWLDVQTRDFNFDGNPEVAVATDRLAAFFQPATGGQLYELDVRAISHNLLATLARRPEAYHEKVLRGAGHSQGDVASIHDRVVFKQEGLENMVQHDRYLRKALQDHFFDAHTTLDAVASGTATEEGDFVDGRYRAEVTETRDGATVNLVRQGVAGGYELTLAKSISLAPGASALEITYHLEGLPPDRPLHFAIEFNFAGLPDGTDDRYYYDADRHVLGQLGAWLDLRSVPGVGLIDEWLGVDIGLSCNRPTDVWTFPIHSVSQSEGGFEAVHQSVVVMPHWRIQGDAQGRWGVSLTLSLDTSLAERRQQPAELAAVASQA
ncbi:MAG: DUF1926 domain-containing protein, partial [Planctomycetales bacterium]|nr:DUF1926 domain-containing protein [Planctomycetales bacterium]